MAFNQVRKQNFMSPMSLIDAINEHFIVDLKIIVMTVIRDDGKNLKTGMRIVRMS